MHPLAHRLGVRRDRHDPRDHRFEPKHRAHELPPRVDLRAQMPPVYDQGRIQACTANVLAAAVAYSRRRNGQDDPALEPSRLFIYWNERALQDNTANDCGATLREGIRTLATQGVAPEHLWPYDDTPATTQPGGAFPPGARVAQKPADAAFEQAHRFEVLSYRRIAPDLDHMKSCLAEGYPFALGLQLYPGFMEAPHRQATVIPLPAPGEAALGGHAVLAVGYDDGRQWLVCRNSWGPAQADGGYFYLPYAYLQDAGRVGDLWSVRTVEH